MARAWKSKPVGENQFDETRDRWEFVAQQRWRTEVRRCEGNVKPRQRRPPEGGRYKFKNDVKFTHSCSDFFCAGE
jgi:hypothetical protein